jgi:ATP-dependent protease HslVU (ClpYQ) peptidase subunit
MTAIVGLVSGGTVWMGGDSATSWQDDRVSVCSNPKVFRVGHFLVGSAGSGRTQRILRHAWTPPPRRKLGLEHYISVAVVDSIRRALIEGGAAEKKDNVEDAAGDILLGYRGHLFRVDSDYNVDEAKHSFDAVGCGAVPALAAVYANPKASPKQRILTALRAAQEFNAAVRGPFTIESV